VGSFVQRIEQLMSGQSALIPVACSTKVERHAQRLAARLIAARKEAGRTPADGVVADDAASLDEARPALVAADMQTVDVASLDLVRPRCVGVEQVGLWAMQSVDFTGMLKDLGLSGPIRSAVVGSIVARMAAPGSERAAWRYLAHRSAA
jgi:hypothetical protein